MSNRKQTHLCVINQSCGDWKSRWQDRVLLTGCWGASLSILKTCATFPLARRCILKPGMAHLVARLIILEQWEREGEKGRITQMLVQIFIRCVLKTKINETDCGSDYFQICIIICKSHLQHVLFCISNLLPCFFSDCLKKIILEESGFPTAFVWWNTAAIVVFPEWIPFS